MLCIAEEAAQLWVAGCNEQERGWVPRRELESWLCLMHEVVALRLPLVSGRAGACRLHAVRGWGGGDEAGGGRRLLGRR